MESVNDSSSLKDIVTEWWQRKREERRALHELLALPQETLAELAADCGLSADTLVELTRAGPHAADEMNTMMDALGIDAGKVEAQDRATFADLRVNCARCDQKSACRSSLAEGTAFLSFNEFCNNGGLERLFALLSWEK